jgi:hypothetical protein
MYERLFDPDLYLKKCFKFLIAYYSIFLLYVSPAIRKAWIQYPFSKLQSDSKSLVCLAIR